VTGQADASERLAAERASALERLNGLERELRGIIESADTAGTDDEHDPEGATIAFERQHVAALLDQAREHLAQIDAAMRKLATRPVLLVASDDDPYAARSSREIQKLGGGPREIVTLKQAGHGTAMLGHDPDLPRVLVDWFRRTLL